MKLSQKLFFPISIKYLFLLAYVFLIIVGLGAYPADQGLLVYLRNTNLGNLIVWSYWWPSIIIGAIFFGRVWCMVCPVELITSISAKIGWKNKRPKWVLSGWGITFFYILILFIGIQGLLIHRNPFFMSLYLLTLVLVAIVVGLIYEKNTFCRSFCPVGYLLGLYARLAFYGWRIKNKATCETCQDKSCIHKEFIYNLNVKSCGVDLYPAKIDSNSRCILCTGCLKTCARYQTGHISQRPNPGFVKIGFAKDLFSLKPMTIPEMVFVLAVSGFVISEIWFEWKMSAAYLMMVPEWILQKFNFSHPILMGVIEGFILFTIFPLLLWLFPYGISKLAGSKLKIREYLLNYGIAFIPIIAAAHLDKAILKMVSRVPYFSFVGQDITGISTARLLQAGSLKLPTSPHWMNLLVSVLLILIILVGIYLSITVILRLRSRYTPENVSRGYLLIPVVYGSVFLGMLMFWRFLA